MWVLSEHPHRWDGPRSLGSQMAGGVADVSRETTRFKSDETVPLGVQSDNLVRYNPCDEGIQGDATKAVANVRQ